MKKFHIIIFGCQMNYSDSARIKAILTNAWFSYTDSKDDADIVIFDTCSVRQKSEDKIFGALTEIRPDQKIRLSGCMIQHYLKTAKIVKFRDKKEQKALQLGNFVGGVKTTDPTIIWFDADDLEGYEKFDNPTGDYAFVNYSFDPLFKKMHMKFPNVELFFRIDDVGLLPKFAAKLGYEVSGDVELTNEYSSIIPHGTNQLFKENTKTAYVPISTWCNQFCAYCIVPYSRGLEKNRPLEEIITEVEYHLSQGAEEITLLGQIVNKHPDFVEILRRILLLPGLRWLRYTSPYPTYYTPELLALHENEEKLCPHIHMPLQSGSDTILKSMFRGYTVEQYKQFVDNIRALKRPISITTDIIIGFCGETEEDFQASLDLMEYARFDMVYMGIYSPRPGTIAAKKLKDDVPREVKKERRTRMNDLLRRISLENNQSEIGTLREVMINKVTPEFIAGYSDNMKNVIVNDQTRQGKDITLGNFVKLRIKECEPMKLFAEMHAE